MIGKNLKNLKLFDKNYLGVLYKLLDGEGYS